MGVRFIILEEGAHAFEPPKPPCEAPFDVVVLVQSAGETVTEFASRALRRLALLERSDRMVVEAVIAAGEPSGPAVLSVREALARAILHHLSRFGAGEIVLAAGSAARPELRHELMALAGSLTGEFGAPGACVRVLFSSASDDPDAKSGIHPAIVTRPLETEEPAPNSSALTA